MKKRKVLITMNDDLYKRVEILAEKCHRSRPDQFRHLLLTHPDMCLRRSVLEERIDALDLKTALDRKASYEEKTRMEKGV